MKLYVGNLPLGITDAELKGLFSRIGKVKKAIVVLNKKTGLSYGYGYVEMAREDGQRAISELNGFKTQSRTLFVKEVCVQNRGISSAAAEFCANGRSTLAHLNDDIKPEVILKKGGNL
jgi:cold-inducible RNA-binding protein